MEPPLGQEAVHEGEEAGAHLTRLYGRLLDELPRPPHGSFHLAPEDLRDLRRLLYGLHATLRLHFAQEDEQYLPLLEAGGAK